MGVMDRSCIGHGAGLQASWFPLDPAICGHTRLDDSKAWLMATMGRYSKETVLEAVRSRCERDVRFRESLFFELMHAPDEEQPVCCEPAIKQAISNSPPGFVDMTSNSTRVDTFRTGQKRKLDLVSNNHESIKKHKSQGPKWKPFNCGQCNKLCTGTTDRENGSCLHHPGSLEVDDDADFWADEDDYVHGRIDTTRGRCEVPEGFYWTCCGNAGTSRGCVISSHGDVGRSHLAKLRGAGFPC